MLISVVKFEVSAEPQDYAVGALQADDIVISGKDEEVPKDLTVAVQQIRLPRIADQAILQP